MEIGEINRLAGIGLNVQSSPIMNGFFDSPKRIHRLMCARPKASYHHRIQKKWNKRFGFKREAHVFCTGNTIFCHPDVAALIEKAFAQVNGNAELKARSSGVTGYSWRD
jgi:hypothetical protein